jgi:lipoate-protein ligase A
MEVNLIEQMMRPHRAYALAVAQAQRGNADGYAILCRASRDEIALATSCDPEIIDLEAARNAGYPVFRFHNIYSGEYSSVMMSEDTLTIGFALPSDVDGTQLIRSTMEATSDALQALGLDAHVDHSGSGNDVILHGKKIAGVGTDETDPDWTYANWFLSLNINYDMAEYLSLPDSKFDGKLADTIKQRATSIWEHDDTVTFEETREALKTALADHPDFPVTSYKQSNISGTVSIVLGNLASTSRSDDYILGGPRP